MMMSYQITPYVGVGSLRFGMTRAAAESELGPPALIDHDDEEGTVACYWHSNTVQLVFRKQDDHLVLLSLYGGVPNITIENHPVDWARSSILYSQLAGEDPSARHAFGITVFFKFGVSVNGLLGRDLGAKSITAFERGQWSERDPMLKLLRDEQGAGGK